MHAFPSCARVGLDCFLFKFVVVILHNCECGESRYSFGKPVTTCPEPINFILKLVHSVIINRRVCLAPDLGMTESIFQAGNKKCVFQSSKGVEHLSCGVIGKKTLPFFIVKKLIDVIYCIRRLSRHK